MIRSSLRYVNIYVHIRNEVPHHLLQVSVLIDNIEDIEENPETAQILCTFEGT